MERGISFRSVFVLTHNSHNTCSYRRRLETKRLDVYYPEFKKDRRLGNNAMCKFCADLDFREESACADQMFSCRTCGLQLTVRDFNQIGIRADQNIGVKQFKSIVMDGKVF